MAGRAIRIFLADGTPTGLRTVEIGLSTAKAVIASRTALSALGKRDESRRCGVYVLIGDDPAIPGRLSIYIGEGDDVFQRIVTHDKDNSKGDWDRVALFVSKDQNLTKAHVRYLEARLISIALAAKRATVTNKVEPNGGKLPEADEAEMEELLEHIRIMLSTSGVSSFEAPSTKLLPVAPTQSAVALSMAGEGYSAKCEVKDDEFVVLAGSIARTAEAPSLGMSSRALRAELLSTGVLTKEASGLRFAQDFAFSSASGSAQLICGANVNGKVSWRLNDGRTYKDWQDSQIPDLSEAEQ